MKSIHELKNQIKMNMNMSKKYITSAFVFLAMISANAQVSIGGKQTVEGTATLLDFNSPLTTDTNATTNNNTYGIILPAVDNLSKALPTATTDRFNNNGTFLYDKSDGIVKMYEKDTWVSITGTGDITKLVPNTSAETTDQHGAIIGASTSPAKGVLVLESPDKALVLPRIENPHTSVKSPYAGMMCYDTVSKSLAVFDGTNWNYLK